MSKGVTDRSGAAYAVDRDPTFETARLRVWVFGGQPSKEHVSRVMYVACIKDGPVDWPGIAVSASVWPALGNEVDWVQTSDAVRGHGFGHELLVGIENYHEVKLRLTPVSESGEKLADRLEASRTAETGGAA